MNNLTEGIHHITAIVGHPQETADFYAGILGMRLVKKTVNFEDVGTYHLYFGNEQGDPGTIMTFFNWASAYRGKIGSGQVGETAFAIPTGSLPFWENRLRQFHVAIKKEERFGEMYITFEDTHGLRLALVERARGAVNNWEFNGVTAEVAIKGFAGATLLSVKPMETVKLLEQMGFEQVYQDIDRIRLRAKAVVGNEVDVKLETSGRGGIGVGIVHHIAFRATDVEDQLAWQTTLQRLGYPVTDVKDRNYFHSIYFQEDGGILFEIATDAPGFTVDEELAALGESLQLPARYEQFREQLEAKLLPFHVREVNREGEE